MATLLQIVSAEGQRFSEPPSELGAGIERARASAESLASQLVLVKSQRSHHPFAPLWESARNRLQPIFMRLESMARAKGSVELCWLQENIRLLHAALQDAGELAKIKKTPLVRKEGGGVAPRIMAIAESYLASSDFRFDALAFGAFLDSIQETNILDIAEVWALVPCLKLVLLHETASRAGMLLTHPGGVSGVIDCIRSLHNVGQTSWRSVLEPRIQVERILREDPMDAYASMDLESREEYWDAIAEIAAHSRATEIEVAIRALSRAQEAERAAIHDCSDPRLAERQSHIGYYLVGEGAAILRREVDYRPSLSQGIALFLRRHPDAYYLSGIFLVTAAIVAGMLYMVGASGAAPGPFALAILALLLPCSQVAVELVNYVTTLLLPVQRLPKLDFSEGIPADCATVVAVPTLLLNEAHVRQMVEQLEIRYLGNRDRNLHFALLTDLPDSHEEPNEEDPRVALCAELIANLNYKYADQQRGSFLLLHRHRVYNAREGRWMGWERKRGKIMDFARLLRGEYDSFPVKVGNVDILRGVRFVITLDADTELPRDSAQRMIGAMAHPLNHAIRDLRRNVVVAGFGVLQPRLAVNLQSATRSRLANILAGESGLDIYTRAVSDVYQDLYGEGIFTGKGIWDVDTLLHTLNNRFPENALLSHDLIEGAYARTGLASDIELVDDYPSHFSAFSRRKHRWIRGDWQIAEWLLPQVREAAGKRVPNPLSRVSRWKIFDNLRRSLVEPATFLMLLLGWLALPGSALRWTLAAIILTFASAWIHFVSPALEALWKRNLSIVRRSLPGLLAANSAALLRLAFVVHQTLLSLDAIVRVLVRRLVTQRGLLEWETAAEAELGESRGSVVDLYLRLTPVLAAAFAIAALIWRPEALGVATPILILWGCSRPISRWLNQPPHAAPYEISEHDRLFLRGIALRTWRYFAEHSTAERHWLIPDNVQEDISRVADRTSPTDIGLLLNARQVACEMGYLTVPEFVRLTAHTLSTLEDLPKFRGHLFNWYNTITLQPLSPQFVSSADSGNLMASLWSLSQGCLDLLQRPLLPDSLLTGFSDYLRLMNQHGTRAPQPAWSSGAAAGWLQYMRESADRLPDDSGDSSKNRMGDPGWFAEEAHRRCENVNLIVRLYCPWLLPEFSSLLARPEFQIGPDSSQISIEQLPALIDALSERLASALAGEADRQSAGDRQSEDRQSACRSLYALLGEAHRNAMGLIRDLRRIAGRAGQLAGDMDFRFLFNTRRNLLAVGFDAGTRRLETACYDLLASEARLAVFSAIAKEDIPQEAWFLMGRTHGLNNGRAVLLSWTGTMFEYLMPSLWMRTYPGTLLASAYAEAVRSQQAYAAVKRTFWGISESAHAERDEAGNYQYSAFGVAPLALHQPETASLVISPYSTLLSLSTEPVGALHNLRRMAKEGWLQNYGFYEAADYTPSQRSSRRTPYELVRCWMAHHQGMSMLAIANLLHENIVQRWFHDNPRVQATERLLQEKPVAWVQQDDLRSSNAA